MRLEQLEGLLAVTRTGSIRRACEELHISQPALSESLRALETELGVTLLERRRDGARISADGQDLLPFMAEVLESVQRLRARAAGSQLIPRLVRLGTVHAGTAALVGGALERLRHEQSQTQVELVTATHDEVQQLLQDGRIDLALVNVLAADDLPPDLASVPLLRGRAVACLSPDHPLAGQREITVEQLFDGEFIAMRAGFVMHRLAHRLLAGREVPFAYTADGAELGKLLAAQGLGVTLLPDYSVLGDPLHASGSLVTVPVQHTDVGVSMVLQHRRGRMAPAVHELQVALRRAAREFAVRHRDRPESEVPRAG